MNLLKKVFHGVLGLFVGVLLTPIALIAAFRSCYYDGIEIGLSGIKLAAFSVFTGLMLAIATPVLLPYLTIRAGVILGLRGIRIGSTGFLYDPHQAMINDMSGWNPSRRNELNRQSIETNNALIIESNNALIAKINKSFSDENLINSQVEQFENLTAGLDEKEKASNLEKMEVMDCSLSTMRIKNPITVISKDKHEWTYEKESLIAWINSCSDHRLLATCPATRAFLKDMTLENRFSTAIHAFLQYARDKITEWSQPKKIYPPEVSSNKHITSSLGLSTDKTTPLISSNLTEERSDIFRNIVGNHYSTLDRSQKIQLLQRKLVGPQLRDGISDPGIRTELTQELTKLRQEKTTSFSYS